MLEVPRDKEGVPWHTERAPGLFGEGHGGGDVAPAGSPEEDEGSHIQRGKCAVLSTSSGQRVCIRREGAAEAAPEAVRQAAGGGCQRGWRRLLSITNAIEADNCGQRDSGWAIGWAPWRGGVPPPLPMHPWEPPPPLTVDWRPPGGGRIEKGGVREG